MRVLVTGGCGFIGSHVVRRLSADGHRVLVLDNMSSGRRSRLDAIRPAPEIIEGDIRDAREMAELFARVDGVVHLAACVSVVETIEDPVGSGDKNVGGTLAVLEAARDGAVESVVFASSSAVYGNARVQPIREDTVPAPISPYGLQKLTGEHYMAFAAEHWGLRCSSLRFFNVFGPGQSPDSDYAAAIPRFVEAVQAGRAPTVHGDGLQTRDFVFVEDVADAIVRALSRDGDASIIANIAAGERISIRNLAEQVVAVARRAELMPEPGPARPGDIRDSYADVSEAARILDWRATTSLEEGLRRIWAQSA